MGVWNFDAARGKKEVIKMEMELAPQYVRRHHKHEPAEYQCTSSVAKHIKAPVDIVISSLYIILYVCIVVCIYIGTSLDFVFLEFQLVWIGFCFFLFGKGLIFGFFALIGFC